MTDIKTININDNLIDYFTFGEGKKVMVILPGVSINNIMNYRDSIINQYKLFHHDFKVYVFNYHSNLNKDYSFLDISKDFIEVFKTLKLDNIYLYGVSSGGFISLLLLTLEESLIKKSLIASSALYIDDSTFIPFNKMLELIDENKIVDLSLFFGETLYTEDVYLKSKDALIDMANNASKVELDRFKYLLRAMRNFDIREEVKTINKEVLFVNDKSDKLFNYLDIENEIKDNDSLDIYTYDTYSHAFYDLNPEFMNKLYEFFNS